MPHLFNPLFIEKTEQCRIRETPVDVRYFFKDFIAVLDKLDGRWSIVNKRLVESGIL